MKQVTILAVENTFASSVTGPLDILSSAGALWNGMEGGEEAEKCFDVRIVSTEGGAVECRNGLSLPSHGSIDEVEATDLIVVSELPNIEEVPRKRNEIVEWLKKHADRGAVLAGIGTGVFLLAETGLLDGKNATTHWAAEKQFRQRYPNVPLDVERLITDEEDLLCSGGGNAAFDLCLYLVEKYYGRKKAVHCAKTFMHDLGRDSQTPYLIFQAKKGHEDEQILASQQWIEENYRNDFGVGQLAQASGMSQRTYERRFKRATTYTPLAYLQRIRVEAAKKMLEIGDKSFDEISSVVGYHNSGSFRKVFVKNTGLLPQEYRKRYQRC